MRPCMSPPVLYGCSRCRVLCSSVTMSSTSVQVAVRARPLSQRELDSGTPFCVEVQGNSTLLYKSSFGGGKSPGRSNVKDFVYDHSYWSVDPRDDHYTSQETVFEDLGTPVLQSAFEGYNSCIFAYGQTGSGKTYTMMGTEMAIGLIPRICEGLYARMTKERQRENGQVSYKTEVSYMEIYNEKVRDLLRSESSTTQHSLRVREHPKDGPYVEASFPGATQLFVACGTVSDEKLDLSKHSVTDYAEISKLIDTGNSRRATASTKMNDVSSRSHAIFTIRFSQAKYCSGMPSETTSKIHLVDLAGSERASLTGADGERLKEGGSINRSLVCLGTVISSLAEMSTQSTRHKKPYISYRDSVLTWLLKDSLGGNSKTIMIATISPAESSYGETLSTLRYAGRAKNIMNKPTVNEDPNAKLIREMRTEIQRLKSIIASGNVDSSTEEIRLQSSKSISLAEDLHKKEEQVAELTTEWVGKWKDIQRIVQERNLALHSEGVKMVVDSQQPHFVGVDPDILSTGLVFYYFKDGETTIGSRSGPFQPDIVISGSDICAEHCKLERKGNKVVLHPLLGKCFVNHRWTIKPKKMSQGDLLQLGCSTVFRFNNPQEAENLRRKQSEGLLLPRKYVVPAVKYPSVRSMVSPLTVQLQSRAVVTASAYGQVTADTTVMRSHHQTERLLEQTSYVPELPERSEGTQAEAGGRSYRRPWWYYFVLLMCTPLLLFVVMTLTFPAMVMLAMLIISVKVFGVLQYFWLSRWLATLVAMGTTVLVSPVAGLCDVFYRLTFSILSSLRIIEPQNRLLKAV